jgi:hypothetical protein
MYSCFKCDKIQFPKDIVKVIGNHYCRVCVGEEEFSKYKTDFKDFDYSDVKTEIENIKKELNEKTKKVTEYEIENGLSEIECRFGARYDTEKYMNQKIFEKLNGGKIGFSTCETVYFTYKGDQILAYLSYRTQAKRCSSGKNGYKQVHYINWTSGKPEYISKYINSMKEQYFNVDNQYCTIRIENPDKEYIDILDNCYFETDNNSDDDDDIVYRCVNE